MKSNLFITGFSGSGKTSVGREVARRLGWRFVDTDDDIVRTAGKPIEAIFGEMGEGHFRRLEHRCLAGLCKSERQVIATGGGIVVDERNRRLMERSGVIVCLEARPETIHKRLERQRRMGSEPVVRPMLSAQDPLERIRRLKEERQAHYALAHWTVHTDRLSAQQAAEEVLRVWNTLGQGATPADDADGELAAVVQTSSGDCPIWVGWGILDELGQRVRQMLAPSAAYIISDEGVYTHARQAQAAMESATIPTHLFLIPPGEPSKSLEMAQRIYGWLADRRAERGHLLLAVGGGVVGDLAGFVAATFLRGMPFVQVPTTLLAMMDAAIGGKVAVDLPQGKNLVGTFHQPRFVLSDVAALKTLPERELTSGWAEAIKHGLILDQGLVEAFERHGEAICGLEPEVATDVIRRSVRIKADVVSRDERETLGVRVLLNYGPHHRPRPGGRHRLRGVPARRGRKRGDDGSGLYRPRHGPAVRRGGGATAGPAGVIRPAAGLRRRGHRWRRKGDAVGQEDVGQGNSMGAPGWNRPRGDAERRACRGRAGDPGTAGALAAGLCM